MPDTYRQLGVTNPFNPKQNINAGTYYFKEMLDRYKRTDLALAAYNAGPAAVDKYNRIPPYRETKGYVREVLHYYRQHHNKDIELDSFPSTSNNDKAVERDTLKAKLREDLITYKKIVILEPGNKYAHYKLAKIYQELNQHYKAIIIFTKLMRVETDSQKKEEIKNQIKKCKLAYGKKVGIKFIHLKTGI